MSPIRRLRRSARLQAALDKRGCGRGKPGAPNSSNSQPVRRTVKFKGKGRAVPMQPTNSNVQTAQLSTAEVQAPQETASDDPIKWDLYPHLTERLKNNPDACAIPFDDEEEQGTHTEGSAFRDCQLSDYHATYEEEEELSGSKEFDMDLYHDLDSDHAMVDAALDTLEDGIIHQRQDAYSHPFAQQPVQDIHSTPEYRALSWDGCFSPYSRFSSYAYSTSSSSSSDPSSTSWRHALSVTSQTSASKGKLSQADHESCMDALNYGAMEQRTQIALLRNEYKATKFEAYMHDKEIARLEVQNARDRDKAEICHQQMMEIKRMDIELLQSNARVITLKIELAQLHATRRALDQPVSHTAPGSSSR